MKIDHKFNFNEFSKFYLIRKYSQLKFKKKKYILNKFHNFFFIFFLVGEIFIDGDSNQMLMFMRSPRIRLGRRRPRKIASAKLFHRWGGEDMDRFGFIYFLYTSYCLVFKLIFLCGLMSISIMF